MLIVTKYLGPTDRRGSRVKARLGDETITIRYESELSTTDNHIAAARAVARKAGLDGALKFATSSGDCSPNYYHVTACCNEWQVDGNS